MNRILLVTLLLSLLNSFNTYSQKDLSKDYSYTVSEPYQVYDSPRKSYFTDGESILSVKPWKKQVVLQKYEVAGLKSLSAEKYEDLPKNAVVEGMIQLQDRYYLFFSSWTGKKTQHEQLFAREIDFATGKFKGDANLIIDIDGRLAGTFASTAGVSAPFSFGSIGVTDKFDFFTSADESKLMIQYRRKPEVKNDKKSFDIIGAEVFDISLAKLWGREYTMPYTERRMDVEDFAVDANGVGYLLAKVFLDDSGKDKKRRKDEKANYYMELLTMISDDDNIIKTKIDLNDKFVNGISIFESFDGKLVCAGYYAAGTKRDLDNADGLFTMSINQNGELGSVQTYEIPLDVINQFEKKSTKRKNERKNKDGKAEFENIRLSEIRFFEDGSLLLIGEQFYQVWHQTRNGGYYTYHYYDILVSRIDAAGDLSWMKKIPKKQVGKPGMGQVYDTSTTYMGGMSYTYMYTNNTHYVIYLDNVKNIELSLDKLPAQHTDGKGGYLTAVKIDDASGNIEKGSIFDMRNLTEDFDGHQFGNNRVIQTQENEFIVELYKKKKEDVLVKVKIQ